MALRSLHASFLLALLVFLPLAVNSQVFGIPTINLRGAEDKQGNVKYSAELALQTGQQSGQESPNKVGFLLDLKAQQTSIAFSCSSKTTKAELWALLTGDGGIVASTADSLIGSIQVVCKKDNIAGLSSSQSSLPSQVVRHLDKRPLRFATVLFGAQSGGTLYIGRVSWIQFTSIAPERTEPVTFVNIPMKLVPSGGYSVELTSIGFQTSTTAYQKLEMEMNPNERFTKLPSNLYQFVLGQFHLEAIEKKISQASTSYGKLARCYSMTAENRSSFHNLTMVFSGRFRWSVTGEEYLVQKPGSGNVFCLAFVEASAGHPGVIGTMQQSRRVVEYQLDKKILAVSLPLVGGLISP